MEGRGGEQTDGWIDGFLGHKEKFHKNTGNGAEVKGRQNSLFDLDP